MEAIQQNNLLPKDINKSFENSNVSNNITFTPYLSLIVKTLSDFSNERFPYSRMLSIGQKEIELLLVAKRNNPGKINIERLAPRYIRLAILNAMKTYFAP